MFSFREISDLCDLPYATLCQWVTRGAVIPAVRGGKGRGHAGCFSPKHGLGLAFLAATRKQWVREGLPAKLPTGMIRLVMAGFEKLSDDETAAWATGKKPTAWQEEEAAKSAAEVTHYFGSGDLNLLEDFTDVMDRVRNAIALRLSDQAEPRITQPKESSRKRAAVS